MPSSVWKIDYSRFSTRIIKVIDIESRDAGFFKIPQSLYTYCTLKRTTNSVSHTTVQKWEVFNSVEAWVSVWPLLLLDSN